MNALKLAITIALGLGIRALTGGVFAKVAGDMLYAVAAYYAVALVLRRHRAPVALGYCVAIECLQLHHPPWLESLRATLFGRLVLGSVFSFYDLLSYAAGIALAVGLEEILARRNHDRLPPVPSS